MKLLIPLLLLLVLGCSEGHWERAEVTVVQNLSGGWVFYYHTEKGMSSNFCIDPVTAQRLHAGDTILVLVGDWTNFGYPSAWKFR